MHGISSRIRTIATLVAAVVLVFSPLLSRPSVQDLNDLEEVLFGWPIGYVTQDQSSLSPPLPYRTQLLSPLEYPTGMNILRLFLSGLSLAAAAFLLGPVIVRLASRTRRHRSDSMDVGGT